MPIKAYVRAPRRQGCFYGFSVYSVSLKHQCALSQASIDNINTIPYGFGVISILINKLAQPLGVRLTLVLAAVLEAAGLIAQYVIATHCEGDAHVRAMAPTLLVVFSCVTYFGNALVTSIAFPIAAVQGRCGAGSGRNSEDACEGHLKLHAHAPPRHEAWRRRQLGLGLGLELQ